MDGKTQQLGGVAIKDAVRARYGEAAAQAKAGANPCCGGGKAPDPISSNLYAALQKKELPDAAVLASLGCGNPTALANLHPGEVVLDLGSGGGIDVLLSARRVGPTGKVYGLDMTDEMLSLARENQQKAGIKNVEFLKGEIENIPLPGNSVDVIISNCVVNLSGDKNAVLRESLRVLKPGGRLAIADVVTLGEVPDEVRANMGLWLGCLAGALNAEVFAAALKAAGFQDVSITPERIYEYGDARSILEAHDIDTEDLAKQMQGKFASAFVRASKPLAKSAD
ncbi:MAG: arsenite methyltransferase [Steroidobacteraceae bacterium]